MRGKFYGSTIDERLSQVPNELAIDAVGLWQIVSFGRQGFDLSGEPLTDYVRRHILALLGKGVCIASHLRGNQTTSRHSRYPKLGRGLFVRSRHGAPDRKTQKMPLRTRRSPSLGTPPGSWEHRLDDAPLIVIEFISHGLRLQFGALNHGRHTAINPSRRSRGR